MAPKIALWSRCCEDSKSFLKDCAVSWFEECPRRQEQTMMDNDDASTVHIEPTAIHSYVLHDTTRTELPLRMDSALIHQHSSPSQLIHWRVLWWRKARFACPTVRHLYIAVGSILSTDMFTQLYSYLTLFMLLQSIMHVSGGPMG